jgi:hypothetical protein
MVEEAFQSRLYVSGEGRQLCAGLRMGKEKTSQAESTTYREARKDMAWLENAN